MLVLAAAEVASFGDWLIRAQYDLFHRMMGEEADRIVFLPMADLTSLLRPELTVVAERANDVSAIKAEVGREQLSAGIEPYTRRDRKSVRVGKECRSRWSPYHQKKKKKRQQEQQ